MALIDDKIAQLTAKISAENTVIDSVLTLVSGLSAELAATRAALANAGVTDAQLQALTDLGAAVDAKAAGIAAAVANMPTPAPAPTPDPVPAPAP